MKNTMYALMIAAAAVSGCKKGAEKVTAEPLTANAQQQTPFQVVGYLWANATLLSSAQKIDMSKITHLNIAFINPDAAGNFSDYPDLPAVVQLAHDKGVLVLMSCGGGSSQAYYANLLKNENRPMLVSNFLKFLDKYKLDGIDVDLEGDDIDQNYEAFIVDLRQPLTDRYKLLTSAQAWWTREKITDKALKQFDFINIMAYDKTGPWNPSNPGQHSPISYANDHFNYWGLQRGVKKEDMILGLPFYGYGFGPLADDDPAYREMSWQTIQQKYPDRIYQDEIVYPNGGGIFYYNGLTTIKAKTELAVQKGGGVMIWQLMFDSFNQNSLLNLIDKTHKETNN